MEKILSLLITTLLWHLCFCTRIERVVVPSTVIAGRNTELQCLYTEEYDELYTLKWWRGDDNFYQYLPPRRSFFPTPGVRVDMNATTYANRNSRSGLERVFLKKVGLDTAGVFKCEVIADKTFKTVFKEANMSVVFPPSGPPSIFGMNKPNSKIKLGEKLILKCSVPPATPPPIITWEINGMRPPIEWTSDQINYAGGLPKSISKLEFTVHQSIIEDGSSLNVECIARQHGSGYYDSDSIVLMPERTSFLWFFSSGSSTISSIDKRLVFCLFFIKILLYH